MRVAIWVSVMLGVLMHQQIAAQSEPKTGLDWLADKGIEIRKTFSGTVKDGGEPASFTYFNPDQGKDFYGIDLAFKLPSWQPDVFRDSDEAGGVAFRNWQGRLYSTVEYHRRTEENAEVNNASLSGGFEWERHLGGCNSKEKQSIRYCHALFSDLKAKVKRDEEKNTSVRSFEMYFGAFGSDDRWPGDRVELFSGALPLIYMPTIGLEHYDNLPIETKVNGETVVLAPGLNEFFARFSLNLQIFPFARTFDENLVLVLTHTERWLAGSSPVIDRQTRFTEASLDYYLDAKRRVALGFSVSSGQSSDRNFLDENKSSLGLKLKL